MTWSASLLVLSVLAARGEDVLARVDDTTITRAALERRAEAHAAQRRPTAPDHVMEALVIEALLAGEARRAGLVASPELAAYVERETRKAAGRAFIDEVASRSNPSDAELRRIFHMTSDFARFEFLSFATRAEADAALARLRNGSSMAAEARTAAVSRLYEKPSDSPMIMRGEILPAIAEALFPAAPGQLVGPVQDDAGWTVARLLEKQTGSDEAFAARREAVLAFARKQAAIAAREHLVEQLRASATIHLDEPFLRGLKGAEATPEQLQHVIATADGEQVRYVEIHGAVRSLGGQSGHMAGPTVKVQLAKARVDEVLVESVALKRGFAKSAAVVAQRSELERTALANMYADTVHRAVPAPTDRDIEAFYKQNAGYYRRPFSEVLPRVAADAQQQKRGVALAERIEQLRKKAKIAVDAKALTAGVGGR